MTYDIDEEYKKKLAELVGRGDLRVEAGLRDPASFSDDEDLIYDLSAALAGLIFTMAMNGQPLRVHVSTPPDMETRVTLLNEGYELAMAQHLADDPTVAQDWLDQHDANTRLDQQKRDAKIARESFSLNAHLYSRRAAEKIAMAIEEQES